MALRAIMINKKIKEKRTQLEAVKGKAAGFVTREAELEAAIEEAQTDEEQKAVEGEIDAFEQEKKETEEEQATLEKEISELEEELKQVEERQDPQPAAPEEREEREVRSNMANVFFGLNEVERDRFLQRDAVKKFLAEVRTCIKEKRALTNVGLTVPQEMLPILRTVTEQTSKLIGLVNRVSVAGTARQLIMGAIPEAVWTEMCATLNELSLGFNNVEVDGYKVGGFFTVCNAILEDNDVNLATEIINALGKSIGKALDKAIIYGKGTKMPLGIVTRLAQTIEPSGYPTTARAWEDLHTSHIITGTGATGLNLFKEIVTKTAVAINDYFDGELTFAMNPKTYRKLQVESMDKNMNGALVAGVNGTVPVVNAKVVELSFIPENDIVFGYFDAYLLAERAGTQLSQSEHYKFVEDQTVFKGTARYDGKPVIAEAFGLISITTTAPTTTVTFPTDTAN